MPCEEWCRLLERYRSAVNIYNEAAMALGDLQGTAFNEAWQRVERARAKCTRGRADLLHHEHNHACLDPEAQKHSGITAETSVLRGQGQAAG
jgi:hypothetical protein